jgi:hypothetical protein
MLLIRRFVLNALCLFAASPAAVPQGSVLSSDVLHLFSSGADETTAVRFFFPGEGEWFHPPLILRVVGANDANLNTAPMLRPGRTAYITVLEMQHLKQELGQRGLAWEESRRQKIFGNPLFLSHVYAMRVDLVSSRGTASAEFAPSKICETLSPVATALTTPRALWEFQALLVDDGCKIVGFVPDAYPDHVMGR